MSDARLRGVHTIDDLRRRAERRIPRMIADFVAGAAEDEVTADRNRRAFAELTLEPRSLVDVGSCDRTTTVLGEPVRTPVMLGSTGMSALAHRDGELALARAAGDAGAIYVLGTFSSFSIEQVAAVASGPLWFQVYLYRDREVTRSLVERAKAAGCRALVLTVDVPVLGQRERDLRNGMRMPVRVTPRVALDAARRPRWAYRMLRDPPQVYGSMRGVAGAGGDVGTTLIEYVNRELMDPTQSWADLEWLRSIWDGPLVVKGVMRSDDARRAIAAGADAVWVSNHGGRQIDGARSSIELLPEIADAVAGDAELLLDSGVRRGSDVVKAVALGARAVAVARPYWWGLAAGGEAGVRRMLAILDAEIERTMALSGVASLAALDRSAVRVPASWAAQPG